MDQCLDWNEILSTWNHSLFFISILLVSPRTLIFKQTDNCFHYQILFYSIWQVLRKNYDWLDDYFNFCWGGKMVKIEGEKDDWSLMTINQKRWFSILRELGKFCRGNLLYSDVQYPSKMRLSFDSNRVDACCNIPIIVRMRHSVTVHNKKRTFQKTHRTGITILAAITVPVERL